MFLKIYVQILIWIQQESNLKLETHGIEIVMNQECFCYS